MNGLRIGEFEVRGPKIRSAKRLFWVSVICALHVGPQHHASAAPHLVTVRGQAHFTTEVRREADRIIVRGTIADDADEPLGNVDVDLSLSQSSTSLTNCDETRGPSRGKLRTNGRGQFCVSTPGEIARSTVLRLSYLGSELVDKVAKEIELGRAHRTLQLHAEPAALNAVAGAPLIVTVIAREGAAAASGIPLELFDDREQPLGRGETDASGKATIEVANSGAPGFSNWTIRAEGNDHWFPADARLTVTRTTTATLTTPTHTVRIWDQAGSESLTVHVTCDFPVSGAVELWLEGRKLASAPAENNTSTVTFDTLNFAGVRAAELRLASSNEHIVANAASVAIDARPRQALRFLGILVGVLALFVFAFGRSAALRKFVERLTRVQRRPQNKPRPVENDRAPALRGYSGRVVDAYSSKPIVGASIRPITVTFAPNDGTLRGTVHVATDAHGDFEVSGALHRVERWEISAVGFRTREVTTSELSFVRLRRRKHAILEDLIGWARAVGHPFDQKPEPTPGHVARVAGQVGQAAEWARAVEDAAFGDAEIDEARDEELRKGQPRTVPAADDTIKDVR